MSERDEQIKFIQYLNYLENAGKLTYFAVPNAQALSPVNRIKAAINIKKLKAEGFRPGAPDLVVILTGKVVFIEMKAKKGGVVSDNQVIMLEKIKKLNHTAVVCMGFDAAMEVINDNLQAQQG